MRARTFILVAVAALVFVESAPGKPTTFWVGSNQGASIIRLEPLD